MQFNGTTVAAAHIVLQKECKDDRRDIVQRINKICQNNLPQDAVPVFYKLRNEFAIKRFGKRDVEALKKEQQGFVDAKGESISLQN